MIIKTDNGTVVIDDPVVVTPTTPNTPTQVDTTPWATPAEPEQFAFHWRGSDGSVWDLVRGPAYILSGARGFGLPKPTHWLKESLLDGADYEGTRIPPREVYMPVSLESDKDILTTDRSFHKGLNPRTVSTLRVTTPQATWREINCRYVEGADGEYEVDPHLVGRATYPIRFVAPDPYWYGEPIVERYEYASATAAFFTGPPFRLAPAEVLGSATLTNPGDVSTFPVWRVEGPFTGFTLGIGTQLVQMTITKAAGTYITIDARPGKHTIVDESGTDLLDTATAWTFPEIPPGEVSLVTTVLGASSGTAVEVSITPRFDRAW